MTDAPPMLAGAMAMLDAADVFVRVVTLDAVTIDSTRVASATFGQIGYPPTKMRLLANRVESAAGLLFRGPRDGRSGPGLRPTPPTR